MSEIKISHNEDNITWLRKISAFFVYLYLIIEQCLQKLTLLNYKIYIIYKIKSFKLRQMAKASRTNKKYSFFGNISIKHRSIRFQIN